MARAAQQRAILDAERLAEAQAEAVPAGQSGADSRPQVDARGLALGVIAILALVFALHWGRTFFVSLLMGILIAYALNPVVLRMERIRIPRWAGATFVILALSGAAALAVVTLGGQVRAVLEQLPEAAKKVSATISSTRDGGPGTLEKVQVAAREIEKATNQATGAPASARPGAALVVEPQGFSVKNFVWTNTAAVAAFAGHAVMVMFLAFFLLLSGDAFKRKLVRLAGPSLSSRRITLQVMSDISVSIQNYMFMLLATNALLACLSWVAFKVMGLENAGAWALAAGLLHFIPYAGTALLCAAIGVSAFMQFGTVAMVLTTVGVSLVISSLVGMIVATWMTGKLARMNQTAVFVALLFWGWLWGVWGLLLAIPIIVSIKVASELIEQLHPVAELLRA